jgi:hypothetical protein
VPNGWNDLGIVVAGAQPIWDFVSESRVRTRNRDAGEDMCTCVAPPAHYWCAALGPVLGGTATSNPPALRLV